MIGLALQEMGLNLLNVPNLDAVRKLIADQQEIHEDYLKAETEYEGLYVEKNLQELNLTRLEVIRRLNNEMIGWTADVKQSDRTAIIVKLVAELDVIDNMLKEI